MPPENTGAGEPQAGASAQPQEGATAGGQEPPAASGQAPAAGAQPGTESVEDRLSRLERENRDLRKEAAGYRTKATTLEQEQQAAKDAGLSELEREKKRATAAEERATALEKSLQEHAIRSAAVVAATRLGYRSPDLAARLLDRGAIEFDSSGQPRNVDELLAAELKAHPELGKGGTDYGGGDRGSSPPSQPTMNELVRAALGRG